ncbi:MAG: VOC family protein [Parvibaculales bacterium]
MLSYLLFGVSDLDKSITFYDAVLGELGAAPVMTNERIKMYARKDGPMMGICLPANGEPASNGNGTMAAIGMPDRAAVDRINAFAVEQGAKSVGDMGLDSEEGFYGRYIRDFDDNKICFFHM